jgi:phage protein U
MGVIGSFGDIIFEVSSEKVRTIDDFSRSEAGRWAAHEIIGQKPKSEFLGPGLGAIAFKMRFDIRFGVNPKTEMDKLLIMCRSGIAETLIVGGTALGVDKWVIKSVTQNWQHFDNAGRCIVGGTDVALEEYVSW